MATCNPTATLTLFRTVISTTIITTSTVVPQTQPDGSVSTVTLPEIITSLITLVNPTSTLYASCSSTSGPLSTLISSSFPQPSPTATTITLTSTPTPFAVTTLQTSTLNNGAITVYSITSTSTPPVSTITSTSSSSPTSKSSSNIAPIIGGAAGGFVLLLGVVALTWFIWKNCRKKPSSAGREDEDVVFPYPVTRDRDGRRLDLNRETRPYEYGLVGGSTQAGAPGRLPAQSHDGRPDSSAPLIGTSGAGLTPMASASGPLATVYGAQNSEQRASQNFNVLPPGAAPAAPRDHYSHSGGSVSASSSVGPTSSHRRPLHVINSPPLPMAALPGPSSGAVPGPSFAPIAGHEPEQQSAWPEKTHSRGASLSSGVMLSNDGQFQGHDPRASVSVPAEPDHVEPTDAPPAYVE